MKSLSKLKLLGMFVLGMSGALFLTYAATNVSIEAQVNTFVQFINRIVFAGTSQAERDLLNPEVGTVIFNSDLHVNQVWNGSYWHNMGSACPSISTLAVSGVHYHIEDSLGGGMYTIHGEEEYMNHNRFGYIEIGGQSVAIDIDAVLYGDRIFSNEEAMTLLGERSIVRMADSGMIGTTKGRAILGGTIDTDNASATLFICGNIELSNDLTIMGPIGYNSLQVGVSGDIYMTVRNVGQGNLEDVQVSITIPSDITILDSQRGSQSTDGSNTIITWYPGTMNPNQQQDYTVLVKPTQTGMYTIIGDVMTSTTETQTANNHYEMQISVEPSLGGGTGTGGVTPASYDYGILTGSSDSPKAVNTSIRSTIYTTNVYNACIAGYGIRVTANLPAGVTYNNSYGGGMMGFSGVYDGMMRTVTWNFSAIDMPGCNELASGGYPFYVDITSSTNVSDIVSWSVTHSSGVNYDPTPGDNNVTHSVVWTGGGTGTGGANVDMLFPYDSFSVSSSSGGIKTGTVSIRELNGLVAHNVVVTATIPVTARYIGVDNTNADEILSGAMGETILRWDLGDNDMFSPLILALYADDKPDINISWNLTTSDNDVSMRNNTMSTPFNRND